MRSYLLPLALLTLAAVVGCDAETPSGGADDDGGQEQGAGGAATSGGTGGTSTGDGTPDDGDVPVEPEGTPELFGSPLGRDGTLVSFDALVATPDAFAAQTVQTLGVVRANCTKRGCWMEVRSPEDAASPGLTVRFVDYGFFIPLDSRGATVKIEGEIAVEILTAEEVEHLESEGYDAGDVQPDGSARILSFTASGVEMWGRN